MLHLIYKSSDIFRLHLTLINFQQDDVIRIEATHTQNRIPTKLT